MKKLRKRGPGTTRIAFEDKLVEKQNWRLPFRKLGHKRADYLAGRMLTREWFLYRAHASSKEMAPVKRVSVMFAEEQNKTIQRMFEAGDVVGAQKLILAELAKEFGGSAGEAQ